MVNLKNIFLFLLWFPLAVCAMDPAPPAACSKFLSHQGKRVEELIISAKKLDPFWQSNLHYLGIVLPEFVTQTHPETLREKGLFKLASFFSRQSCERISIGPFQMQPKFIVETICNYPGFYLNEEVNYRILKEGGIEHVTQHYSAFASLETQLNILKLFILKCKSENPQLQTQKSLSGIRTLGTKYNTGKYTPPNFPFSKINCDKKTYAAWCEYLLSFYQLPV